jgi:hypothetical protein
MSDLFPPGFLDRVGAIANSAPVHILELLLAIVALYLAFKHERNLAREVDSVQELKDALAKQIGHIDEIRNSLPTKREGMFPDYLPKITSMLAESKHTIVICCDYPAYGSFSAPDIFFEYEQTLARELNDPKKKVKVAFLNEKVRHKRVDDDFLRRNPAEWAAWKKKESDKLATYLVHTDRKVDVETLSSPDFVTMINEEDQRLLEHWFKLADEMQFLDKMCPIYFWLVDDEQAVFAIPDLRARAVEHGFYTCDPHLIAGLRAIGARYTELFN